MQRDVASSLVVEILTHNVKHPKNVFPPFLLPARTACCYHSIGKIMFTLHIAHGF